MCWRITTARHARLALGDYEGGWEDYEYRWQWKEFPTRKPKFEQPEWTGDDLNGRTLLVYNEQGLGDTIQFARFLSLAAGRGGKVLFACPEALRALFEGLTGVSQFVGPGERPPAFDVHAPLMSLPRLCGTRYETIPGHSPYLRLPPPSRFPLAPGPPGVRGWDSSGPADAIFEGRVAEHHGGPFSSAAAGRAVRFFQPADGSQGDGVKITPRRR